MPCRSWLNILAAASLKIGLVGKFLLTHHLQGPAIWENNKMFSGRQLCPSVKVRTFTNERNCLPENVLLNSVTTKDLRLKYEKSLHVLPTLIFGPQANKGRPAKNLYTKIKNTYCQLESDLGSVWKVLIVQLTNDKTTKKDKIYAIQSGCGVPSGLLGPSTTFPSFLLALFVYSYTVYWNSAGTTPDCTQSDHEMNSQC
jgi:hypothetical protein